jgi:hypothetical protein
MPIYHCEIRHGHWNRRIDIEIEGAASKAAELAVEKVEKRRGRYRVHVSTTTFYQGCDFVIKKVSGL